VLDLYVRRKYLYRFMDDGGRDLKTGLHTLYKVLRTHDDHQTGHNQFSHRTILKKNYEQSFHRGTSRLV